MFSCSTSTPPMKEERSGSSLQRNLFSNPLPEPFSVTLFCILDLDEEQE